MIALTAKPSFEALDSFDPLRIWSALMQAAWAPWLAGMTATHAAWRALSALGEE
jgi:hypothetical protein